MTMLASNLPTDWQAADNIANTEDQSLFPLIPDQMVDAIEKHSEVREFAPGDMLFPHGQRNAPFFVVKRGRVVFFDRSSNASPNEYFAQVRSGMFIGDISMFTGEPTLAEARAIEPVVALELTHDQLREYLRVDSAASDLILRTLMARRTWIEGHGYGQLQLIGPTECPNTVQLREFLDRNQIPFSWTSTTTDQAAACVVNELGVCQTEYPLLNTPKGVYRNPAARDIARCIGLLPELSYEPYDVAIVGAGPGGLATAVYGASEGLKTVLIDGTAPGGQAGTSSKIENYLGFTTGISGRELSRQAVLQARKFGATICNPITVDQIDCTGEYKGLTLDDGQQIRARAVVLALGARYRALGAENCDRFEGSHLFYAAGHMEASLCHDKPVAVVGGGNSAGQAAVFLSSRASEVYVIIRRKSLTETMSRYLLDRLDAIPNVHIVTKSQVRCLQGESHLERIDLETPEGIRELPCAALFAMIGAVPKTGWLEGCCGLDERGFIPTGRDAMQHSQYEQQWTATDRFPYHLETTQPGVFAVGDVRSGSVKRVATAVGEGSMVVTFVHQLVSAV